MKSKLYVLVGLLLVATTSHAIHLGINGWYPEYFHTQGAGCDAYDQADDIHNAADLWGMNYGQICLRYQSSRSDNPYNWELYRDDLSASTGSIVNSHGDPTFMGSNARLVTEFYVTPPAQSAAGSYYVVTYGQGPGSGYFELFDGAYGIGIALSDTAIQDLVHPSVQQGTDFYVGACGSWDLREDFCGSGNLGNSPADMSYIGHDGEPNYMESCEQLNEYTDLRTCVMYNANDGYIANTARVAYDYMDKYGGLEFDGYEDNVLVPREGCRDDWGEVGYGCVDWGPNDFQAVAAFDGKIHFNVEEGVPGAYFNHDARVSSSDEWTRIGWQWGSDEPQADNVRHYEFPGFAAGEGEQFFDVDEFIEFRITAVLPDGRRLKSDVFHVTEIEPEGFDFTVYEDIHIDAPYNGEPFQLYDAGEFIDVDVEGAREGGDRDGGMYPAEIFFYANELDVYDLIYCADASDSLWNYSRERWCKTNGMIGGPSVLSQQMAYFWIFQENMQWNVHNPTDPVNPFPAMVLVGRPDENGNGGVYNTSECYEYSDNGGCLASIWSYADATNFPGASGGIGNGPVLVIPTRTYEETVRHVDWCMEWNRGINVNPGTNAYVGDLEPNYYGSIAISGVQQSCQWLLDDLALEGALILRESVFEGVPSYEVPNLAIAEGNWAMNQPHNYAWMFGENTSQDLCTYFLDGDPSDWTTNQLFFAIATTCEFGKDAIGGPYDDPIIHKLINNRCIGAFGEMVAEDGPLHMANAAVTREALRNAPQGTFHHDVYWETQQILEGIHEPYTQARTCFGYPTQVRGGDPVAVDEPVQDTRLSLMPASPNPFRYSTTLMFSTPRACWASMYVYDVTGRMVTKLTEGLVGAGDHRISWDGKDRNGTKQSSGIYFAQLRTTLDSETQTAKMLLVD